MDTDSMMTVLRRRWWIVLCGLVLTFGLGFGTMTKVAPTYQAKASVLFLSPPTGSGDNPYLDMSGLAGLADVVATRVANSDSTDALLANGTTGTFTIARDQTTSAPILLIIAKDATAAGALQTAKAVSDLVPSTLASLQSSAAVPTKARVTVSSLTTSKTASAVRKSQLRAVIAVVVLGLIVTLFVVGSIDRAAMRRRRRSTQDSEEAPRSHRSRQSGGGSGERAARLRPADANPPARNPARASGGTPRRARAKRTTRLTGEHDAPRENSPEASQTLEKSGAARR